MALDPKLPDRKTGRRIGGGRESGGLYLLDQNLALAATAKHSTDAYQLHCRLGHPSINVLQQLPFLSPSSLKFNCTTCQLGKHHRASFPIRNISRVFKPFELVHSDVWGPCRVSSFGVKYFVTFIDDYSRTTWLYLIKDRTEVFHSFSVFYHDILNQYGVSVNVYVLIMLVNIFQLLSLFLFWSRVEFSTKVHVLIPLNKMGLQSARIVTYWMLLVVYFFIQICQNIFGVTHF